MVVHGAEAKAGRGKCKVFSKIGFDISRPPHRLCVTPVGVVAQLVERLNGIQEVRGSNPLGSTTFQSGEFLVFAGKTAEIRRLPAGTCAQSVGLL